VPKPSRTWLESVLTRELSPVQAPEQLWAWVHEPVEPRPAPFRWTLAPAAAVLALASAWGLHAYLRNSITPEKQAIQMPTYLRAACQMCHADEGWLAARNRMEPGVY
jgi:hypothetical protein